MQDLLIALIVSAASAPLSLLPSAEGAPIVAASTVPSPLVGHACNSIDLSDATFVLNRGQWRDDTIRYGLRSHGVEVAFRESTLTIYLSEGKLRLPNRPWTRVHRKPQEATRTTSTVLRVTFPGSNLVQPAGAHATSARFNFFVGDDQSRWRTEVPAFGAVMYDGLYDGIDLYVTASEDGLLKYEFRCQPGADHSQIRFRFDNGGDENGSPASLSMMDDNTGDLWIETPVGTLRDRAPVVWQEINGEHHYLPARFKAIDRLTWTIALLSEPDPAHDLVIDPEVEWMTYLGGESGDTAFAVSCDRAGNAFLTGETASWDFEGRNNTFYNFYDAYLAKVSPDGNLQWMTFLGGDSWESGSGVCVDDAGNVHVAGSTQSADFGGATNAFLGGPYDGYLLKVNGGGNLEWMRYVGGSQWDLGTRLDSDAAGTLLMTGQTSSADFEGHINSFLGGTYDAFLANLDSSGQVQWTLFLGGSNSEASEDVATDGLGNLFVTGTTSSVNFAGRMNSYHGGQSDTFVVKVDSKPSVAWMRYLGGSGDEQGNRGGIVATEAGDALIAGKTWSTDLEGRNNSNHVVTSLIDTFVVKVTSTGDLEWATYVGGGAADHAHDMALAADESILVVGETTSTDFEGHDNSYFGNRDAYLCAVSSTGVIQWMRYIGGDDGDLGYAVAVDGTGAILVAGGTGSDDIEGANNSRHGSGDAFLIRWVFPQSAVLTDFIVTFGALISGTLQDLVASDDARIRVRSRFGFTSAEPNVLDVLIGASTAMPNPSLLDLAVEGRLNQTGGTSKLRLRNWSTNALQQIHQYAIGTTETVEEIPNIDATNRVRASDGRIELSIRQSTLVVFTAAGFDSFTDWVEIAVE